MRRRVLEHIPAKEADAADQARQRGTARRRVRRAAAADGARPGRRRDPRPGHAVGPGRAHPGRLRRPRATGPRCTTRTGSCAPSSTGCSCSSSVGCTCVPDDETALRRLGRSLGFLRDPVAELEQALRESRREVRRLHEKLFYRPLLTRWPGCPARTPGSPRRPPGPASPRWATTTRWPRCATSRRSPTGVSRTASIQRTLLPVMLEWFADAPDPDAGLLGFRKISEALGRSPWYLGMLRDEGEVAERMARLLASSRCATSLLRAANPTGSSCSPRPSSSPVTGPGCRPRCWPPGDVRTTRLRPRSTRSARSDGASCCAPRPRTCPGSSTWSRSGRR